MVEYQLPNLQDHRMGILGLVTWTYWHYMKETMVLHSNRRKHGKQKDSEPHERRGSHEECVPASLRHNKGLRTGWPIALPRAWGCQKELLVSFGRNTGAYRNCSPRIHLWVGIYTCLWRSVPVLLVTKRYGLTTTTYWTTNRVLLPWRNGCCIWGLRGLQFWNPDVDQVDWTGGHWIIYISS